MTESDEFNLSKKASYQRFASLADISKGRVQQLVKKEVLVRGESLRQWLNSYHASLRKNAVRYGDSNIQQEAIKAKTRKDNLEADIKEIKIAELTGELCDVGVMEKSISSIKDAFFTSGREAKEKIAQGIKAELDIDIPPELINEPIDEHLAVLEGCNPRDIQQQLE